MLQGCCNDAWHEIVPTYSIDTLRPKKRCNRKRCRAFSFKMLGGYTVRGKGNGEGEGKEVARLLHRGCNESGVCKEPARRLQ